MSTAVSVQDRFAALIRGMEAVVLEGAGREEGKKACVVVRAGVRDLAG